jgi:hypothetical protein
MISIKTNLISLYSLGSRSIGKSVHPIPPKAGSPPRHVHQSDLPRGIYLVYGYTFRKRTWRHSDRKRAATCAMDSKTNRIRFQTHTTRIETDHYPLCPARPRRTVVHSPPTSHTPVWFCHNRRELKSERIYTPVPTVNAPPGVDAARGPSEPEGYEVWWREAGWTWLDCLPM